jgi:hypothetical protein
VLGGDRDNLISANGKYDWVSAMTTLVRWSRL